MFTILNLCDPKNTNALITLPSESKTYDQFDREVTAMMMCNRLKDPHIVRLWWVCMPPSGTIGLPRLVMPVVPGVMMGEWLCRPIENVRRTSLRVVSQLVSAVNHLHENVRIVHGDLSVKNVKIDEEHDHHVTLIDFGNARKVSKEQSQLWVHRHIALSPPEALCGRQCDRILAETHVVGVLLICIERVRTSGLCECPLPFKQARDGDEVCAIARLVQFWGRARLFSYWSEFHRKAGDRIEAIVGEESTVITGKIGRAGMRLADPIANSRQSLAETLRHLTQR